MFHPSHLDSYMIKNKKKNEDLIKVIGEDLPKLLVNYYRFDGRLRNAHDNINIIFHLFSEGVVKGFSSRS